MKQSILIASARRLSLRQRQLVIADPDDGREATRPIEDIAIVVVENPRTTITLPLINALTAEGVALVVCDDKFMPASITLPLDANHVQAEVCRLQADATEPMKKQLWRQLVVAKIRGQAATLALAGRRADILRPYYNNVKSGDTDNREGAAARLYWTELFGRDFNRDRYGPPPNNLLNYGYAVLRAATARALLGSGLMPLFGVFHHNRYDAFPLADDVMEPYRHAVDRIVLQLWDQGKTELDSHTKMALLGLMLAPTVVAGQRQQVETALSLTTASIVRYFRGDTKTITLPDYETTTT